MRVLVVLLAVWVVSLAAYDLLQRKHSILRVFPVIGHLRYLLEAVGPELRQYIVTDNDQERPFSRDERRWVYTSAKGQDNQFGFGTDNRVDTAGYLIINPAAIPLPRLGEAAAVRGYPVPCLKVLGAGRGRAHAFRPASVVNLSGMSFGALSGPAVEALNRGAALAGCLHNTGEGGISPHHRHGGELVFQIGTAYFGCRDDKGRFSLPRLVELVERDPVRAIEIKMSQGAKPGLGGVLPAAKVTPAVAAIRGIPVGRTSVCPSAHTAFHDPDSLLDFVERLAQATGLPVGVKSAVGELDFWRELAHLMATTARGVDFVTVDGGEGGTGSGPLVFTDHVALPFKIAMSRVYRAFAEEGLHDQVLFAGSGRLGFPQSALFAFSLGCDLVNVGREAMLAVGCIQAQRCHTGRCPAGVATQSAWRARGLVAEHQAQRLSRYITVLRKELLELGRSCGVFHPGLVPADQLEVLDGHLGSTRVSEVFGYEAGWGLPPAVAVEQTRRLMAGSALATA